MKRFSKLFLLLFVCLFALTIVACKKPDDEPGKGNGGGETTLDPYWDADGDGIADWTEKEITLTYASWQHNNNEVETIESLMVKEFTKKYPNVKVEMKLVGESSEWDTNMLGLLEIDDLPDVFLVNRLENEKLSLEESIKLYEQAMVLSKELSVELNDISKKVLLIQEDSKVEEFK